MSPLHAELVEVLQVLFGPATQTAFFIQVGAGFLAYLLVFRLLGAVFEFGRTDLPRILGAIVVGLVVMLLAVTAARLHVSPRLVSAQWIRPLAAVAALLAVAIPAHCVLVKTNYQRVLGAMVMAVLASGLVVFFVQTAVSAVSDGRHTVNPTRQRKHHLESLTGD